MIGVLNCMSAQHTASGGCQANTEIAFYAGRSLAGLVAFVQSPATGSAYYAIHANSSLGGLLHARAATDLAASAWYQAQAAVTAGAASVAFTSTAGMALIGCVCVCWVGYGSGQVTWARAGLLLARNSPARSRATICHSHTRLSLP